MITKAFSVYDGKAKTFSVPFFKLTVGMALRDFEDLVNHPETMVNRHPEDFVLYEVGNFDDSNGMLEFISPLNLVATANEYKKIKPLHGMPDLGQIIKPSEAKQNEISDESLVRTNSSSGNPA